MKPLALAMLCVAVALTAFAINFLGVTGGHCGDFGCNGFPQWFYVGSGWLVLACLAGFVLVFAYAAIRRILR